MSFHEGTEVLAAKGTSGCALASLMIHPDEDVEGVRRVRRLAQVLVDQVVSEKS